LPSQLLGLLLSAFIFDFLQLSFIFCDQTDFDPVGFGVFVLKAWDEIL